MGKRAFVRLLVAAFVGAVTIVPLGASADPIAGAFRGTGATEIVRAVFGGLFVEVQEDSIQGPLVEITDDGGINSGRTGRGGGDLIVIRDGAVLCHASDGFTLKVSPRAKSAKLVSNVPGCSGVLKWSAVGIPGAAGEPYVGIAPDLRGGDVGLKAGLKRAATVTGSLAGEPADGGTGDITYLTWIEVGVGVLGGF
jgi:hypothetical protein